MNSIKIFLHHFFDHSERPNSHLRSRSVEPRERIFMKNDNRKNFSSHRELFGYATWGGAWGGGGPLLAHESEGSTSFSSTTHNFKVIGGDQGGAFSTSVERFWALNRTSMRCRRRQKAGFLRQ